MKYYCSVLLFSNIIIQSWHYRKGMLACVLDVSLCATCTWYMMNAHNINQGLFSKHSLIVFATISHHVFIHLHYCHKLIPASDVLFLFCMGQHESDRGYCYVVFQIKSWAFKPLT